MSEDTRTLKAVRDCGEWLAECLRLGWRKTDLDFLEALWWKYHDDQGNLVAAVAPPNVIADTEV